MSSICYLQYTDCLRRKNKEKGNDQHKIQTVISGGRDGGAVIELGPPESF